MRWNRLLSALALAMVMFGLSAGFAYAQSDQTTANQYVSGRVLGNDGTIFVMIPPARIGFDPFLDFYDKSFFTVRIGTTYFTNNNILTLPSNAKKLGPPNQLFTIHGAVDTVRCIWSSRNGVDVIQDCWPIKFTRSGQIMIRWSFKNLDTSAVVPIQCQWLNDVDISDPNDHRPTVNNANDGPIFLHRYGYYDQWQQYPGSIANAIPWFYACFLVNLPGVNNDPGLYSVGYLDYPTIGTTKPSRITMGDWYTLASTIFGPPANYSTLSGKKPGPDDAMLIEFNPTATSKNNTVIGGITSYGTGEFEKCVGNIFALLTYPHRIDWDKKKMVYTPSPFNIEMYAFDPSQSNSAPNSTFTLTACDHLTIWDSLGTTLIGKSQTLPTTPGGVFIGPGGVAVFDWWLKADPVYFCTGDYSTCFKITGTTGLGPPTFVGALGDTCEHFVALGCAETDTLPPLHDAFSYPEFGKNDSLVVHDDRVGDKGLKSITWALTSGGPASNFVVTLLDPVQPCFNDNARHRVTIQQLDSLIGGCFKFTLTDCLGNVSDTELCFPAHPKYIVPDTLPPFVKVTKFGSYDGSDCNSRLDSVLTSDFRLTDKGLDSIYVISSDGNMILRQGSKTFSPPNNSSPYRFGLIVKDSMRDGHICVRIKDAAKPSNFVDTCFYYCTIKDTLAPRISIIETNTAPPTWTVCVTEDAPWDRLIDQIYLLKGTNLTAPNPPLSGAKGLSRFCFDVSAADTTLPASFCVKASDLAGNMSLDTFCVSSSVDTDARKPNIGYSPDPKTNPTRLIVNVDDIHYNDPPANTSKYVWDSGIDSVWFTFGPDPSKPGIFTSWFPATGRRFNCDTTKLPPIILTVLDSLNADSIPTCITIHARDCRGNDSSWTWCYPFTPDLAPPNIVAQYVDKKTVQIALRDDSTYDRGLRSVALGGNAFNLQSVNMTLNRLPDTTFLMTRTNLAQSAAGTISSIDYWGSLFTSELAKHSAAADIRFWIQDLAMKKGVLTRQSQSFDLPVTLVKNDTVMVSRKGIRSFAFSFTMKGDVSQLTFSGIKTAATLTATNWTVVPTQVGNTVTITGTAAAGTVLTQPTAADTVLLYLSFATGTSETTKEVAIEITPITEPSGPESVVYNNFADTTILGINGVSKMPPPWGSLSGSNIVIVGSCAPSLQSPDAHPTRVSMDVPTPNPVSKSVTLHYTVAEDGRVRLGVYDLLGRQVKELYNDTQKQGAYDIVLDVRELPESQYTIRLETGGAEVSRKITVQK